MFTFLGFTEDQLRNAAAECASVLDKLDSTDDRWHGLQTILRSGADSQYAVYRAALICCGEITVAEDGCAVRFSGMPDDSSGYSMVLLRRDGCSEVLRFNQQGELCYPRHRNLSVRHTCQCGRNGCATGRLGRVNYPA